MSMLAARQPKVATPPRAPTFSAVRGGLLQRKCTRGGTPSLSGECEECRKKRLQRKASQLSTLDSDPCEIPAIVHEVLRSPARPLDLQTRAFMEPRFGYDFSRVRVHTGAKAEESARAVSALAYAVGPDIVFGKGQYSTQTDQGRGLIAHELTHVLQQNQVSPAASDLAISTDQLSEVQAEQTASHVTAGKQSGRITPASAPLVQRQEEAAPKAIELAWWEEQLIDLASVGALAFGESAHKMVRAMVKGFYLEVKAQAPAKGAQVLAKVKEAITSPGQIALFVLHYWWGLIKGIFSPITGLFDLAVLGLKLQMLQTQILGTAWTRRNELAKDAGQIGGSVVSVGKAIRDAVGGFLKSPLQTAKALGPWFDSLQKDAESASQTGGKKAADLLLSQVNKPLSELGEIAGEVVGTVLINIVLLVFTEGIGNAISQVASKIGELGSFLGKFGEAAQMLARLATQVGEVLGTIGAWIAKAEAAFAKVAETILKPIAPLLEEFGKLITGLRSFLRKLLGVSEEAAGSALEQTAGKAATSLEKHVPAPTTAAPKTLAAPTTQVTPAADQAAELASAKTVAKPATGAQDAAAAKAVSKPEEAPTAATKATPESAVPQPALHEIGPEITPVEEQVLETTRLKAGGDLSEEELATEINAMQHGESMPSSDPEFLTEVRIENDHTWKISEDGTLCRFSNGRYCLTGNQVEAIARKENIAYWRSVTPKAGTVAYKRATEFAWHKQKLEWIADQLASKQQTLASIGKGHLLPPVNKSVVSMPVDEFIRTNPRLSTAFARLSSESQREFLGEVPGFVGSRETDIVEFFLSDGDIVVTDVTLKATDPAHNFKTLFYKEAMQEMVGTAGPRVSGLDINPLEGVRTSKVF